VWPIVPAAGWLVEPTTRIGPSGLTYIGPVPRDVYAPAGSVTLEVAT
jgi:hypothetical protein